MASAPVPSSSTAPAEKPVLDHVPDTLNRLAVFIAKVFLSREHYVVMDYIIKQVCIREDDLRTILKFEQKYMRQVILQLRQDKLVKERQATEEYDGRPRKISYYFTNYRAIVNVAKYKIDHMRQRLEAREKTKVHKATYKCAGCEQSYDALDMDKIYNPMNGGLNCWRCGQEVEIDNTVGPSTETRSSLAKFNEQMTSLFSMIQQLDGIQLAPHLLEPRLPAATIIVNTPQTESRPRLQVGARAFNGAEANRSDMFKTEFGIRVTIDNGGDEEDTNTEKESVPWLAAAHGGIQEKGDSSAEDSQPAMKRVKLQEDDILGLLREELENPSASQSPSASNQVTVSLPPPEPAPNASSTQDNNIGPTDFSSLLKEEEETVPSGEESGDDDSEEFVFVQGVKHAIGSITTEMVEKMTEGEKKHYTELSMHQYDY